jgi:hypothetical protein
MLRFSFSCLRPQTPTSFHHQPEAQHPKSSAIYKSAGRLPHLWVILQHTRATPERSPEADIELSCVNVAEEHRRGVSKSTFPAME